MKKCSVVILSSCCLWNVAHAQSSVTLYGIIDMAVHYDNHQTASGGTNLTMGSGGVIQGSRWGLMGTEDLGGGNKALFDLESGFTPNTGAFQQATPSGSTRIFGRTADLSLSSNTYGMVTLGRQYALAYEMEYTHDIFALANDTGTFGFQGAGEAGGGRLDNTVRYTSPQYGGFTLRGAYTLGGIAGNVHQNSSPAVSLSYDRGPLSIGTAYQVVNDIGGLTPATSAYGSTYFGITIPDSTQKLFTIGATYTFNGFKLYGSYIYSHVYPADYRNDSFSAAISVPVTPAIDIKTPIYFDFLHHAGQAGTRITGGPLLDYHLSKRTDVYTGIDYTHLTGAWVTLANTSGFTLPFNGFNSLVEGFVGLRHQF